MDIHIHVLPNRENNISFLPDEIEHLTDLKVIDMAENNLQYLPIGMKEIELKVSKKKQKILSFDTLLKYENEL